MTKKTVLNSKERVRISLNWQEPDRVPIQVYLTPEMRQRLERHFTSTAGGAASVQVEPGITVSSNEIVLRKIGSTSAASGRPTGGSTSRRATA